MSDDENELNEVRKLEVKRSSAAKHRIELHKRKRSKRKRPSLPLHVELTAFEASLLQLQQKLVQVKYTFFTLQQEYLVRKTTARRRKIN